MLIRKAKISDAEALLGIYAPYITDTAVTFENKVPTAKNFYDRIKIHCKNIHITFRKAMVKFYDMYMPVRLKPALLMIGRRKHQSM